MLCHLSGVCAVLWLVALVLLKFSGWFLEYCHMDNLVPKCDRTLRCWLQNHGLFESLTLNIAIIVILPAC